MQLTFVATAWYEKVGLGVGQMWDAVVGLSVGNGVVGAVGVESGTSRHRTFVAAI